MCKEERKKQLDYLIEENSKFIKRAKDYFNSLDDEPISDKINKFMEKTIKESEAQNENLKKIIEIDNKIRKENKYIKIGSVVKCTNRRTSIGCKMVGEREDIGQFGIVVGHDRCTDLYRIFFTDYSSFVGVEEQFVEETDYTNMDLEKKRETVLNKIKNGLITPFVLYGDVLTKEVCINYNKKQGWIDLNSDGQPYKRQDSIIDSMLEELIDWLIGERYLLNEYKCAMSEEYENDHKWELSRNRMIDKTIEKIKELL